MRDSNTPYVVIPPPSNDLAACAAHYKWGNGENHDLYVQSGPAYSADASINAMSHELFEAISDPYHTGWIEDGKTAAVGEIGDLCNGNFDPFWARAGNTGPPILASDQAQDGTITLGGQNYVIQKEWSNEDGGCTTATAEPGDFPEIPTVTATTADGKSYAFGTWTNKTVGVQPHGADAADGLGLDRLAVSFDGRTPTPDDFTVDDFGIDVTGNEIYVTNPGTTTVSVTAHNYAGLSETSDPVDVMQDFTPPDIGFSAPAPDGQNGWYTSPVTVTAHPSDALSGVKSTSCAVGNDPPSTTDGSGDVSLDVKSDGTTTLTCTSTDNAGNTSDPVSTTIKIDDTGPPTVTVAPPAPAHGQNGWYNRADASPIAVNVSASKASGGSNITGIACLLDGFSLDLTGASGIGSTNASATAPVQGGDGTKTLSCTATDEAGQTSSPAEATFKLDATLPSLAGVPTTSPNANGWYNHDVLIDWTCSDDASGILGSCPSNSLITGEGTSLTASASVSDVAGNVSNQTSPAVNIDRTAPSVSVVPPSIVHGTNGWFNGQDALPVMVSVTAGDGNGSGVAFTGCTLDNSPVAIVSGQVAVSGDGIHQLFCGATDNAGNSSATGATGSTATIKIDPTAPSFSAVVTPTNPAGTGWYNAATGAPTAGYTCADTTSGLAVTCPSPFTFPQGANQTHSLTITDQAGNSSSVVVGPLNVDTTAPAINLSAPAANAVYAQGQAVNAAYSCPDAVSGLGSCVGTVASGSPIDTSNGAHSFTVTATDKAGNSSSTTVQYVAAAQLPPKGGTCNGYFTGSGTDVTVASGASCHLVPGTSVTHDLTVQSGGVLNAQGITVGHDVKLDGAGGSTICASSIAHDLTVQGDAAGSALMLIGDRLAGCSAGNTVGHDLVVQNNAGPVDVGNDNVSHDLTVQGNKPGGAKIRNNSAGHNATCQNNSPQTGNGNTATGTNSCPT